MSEEDGLVATGAHVVQLFEQERGLAVCVASFLGPGLVADGAALVVATPAHHAAFAQELSAAGVDVAGLRGAGRYVEVDAEQLVRRIELAGRPDADLFVEALGSLVSVLAAAWPLRVYGELVNVLAERGALVEALAVETLWNALARKTPFTLFCAYAAPTLAQTPGGREAVVAQHSAVVAEPTLVPAGPDAVCRRFEPTPTAARAARRFVEDTLERWGLTGLRDAAVLVSGELVGNAIRHGRRRFRLTLSRSTGVLRIGLTDPSPAVPVVRPAVPNAATGGRGLFLVAAMSRRWGTDLHDGGKTVWAELDVA